MSKRSTVGGGNTRVTEVNNDLFSHGGTVDNTYDSGKLIDITHNKPDGTSHSHEVGHGVFGPYAGNIKK